MVATPPVDLTEVKDQLNITDDDDDAELLSYLDAATDLIEKKVGPMVPVTVTESGVVGANGDLLLRTWPVLEVLSIDDDEDVADDLSDRSRYDIGSVNVCLYGRVKLTFRAGYDPVPQALKLATLLTVDHLWDTQRGRAGGFTAIRGVDDDAPVGGDASTIVFQGNAIPPRAKGLIQPYLRQSR